MLTMFKALARDIRAKHPGRDKVGDLVVAIRCGDFYVVTDDQETVLDLARRLAVPARTFRWGRKVHWFVMFPALEDLGRDDYLKRLHGYPRHLALVDPPDRWWIRYLKEYEKDLYEREVHRGS